MFKVAFGEQKMERTRLLVWFFKLRSGVPSVEDAECLGHQTTSKRSKNVHPALVMLLT
jgi:hypothetical protein